MSLYYEVKISAEMQSHSFEFTIKNEDIKNYVDAILRDDNEESLKRIALLPGMIPSVKRAEKLAKELLEKYPISQMFGSQSLQDGRVVAITPGGHELTENHILSLYYEVKISAENQEQADKILNSLLEKKLVTGGQFIKAPARFLWKGKVQDMDYVTITTYTNHKNKNSVIDDVRKTSAEEVPMMTFTLPDDINKELRDWIDETLE